MNKDRRARLDKAIALIQEAKELVEEVSGEEQDAFDNLSENLQAAERGQRMEEVAQGCEEPAGALDSIADELESYKE